MLESFCRSYNTDLSALPNWASSMGVSSEVLQPMTAPGLPQQSSFSVTVGGKQYTSNVAFLWEVIYLYNLSSSVSRTVTVTLSGVSAGFLVSARARLDHENVVQV